VSAEGDAVHKLIGVAVADEGVGDLGAVTGSVEFEEGEQLVALGGAGLRLLLRRHLADLGPDDQVTGLYDAAEGGFVGRVLATTRPTARFFACDSDLEDELVRALGQAGVIEVIEAAGDLASYHSLRQQPFHRHRPEAEVLRRFMGTTSGRKLHYAGLLVAALGHDQVPPPLVAVLTHATG